MCLYLQLCVCFRGMVLMFWQPFYCEIQYLSHYLKRCRLTNNYVIPMKPSDATVCSEPPSCLPALPQHQHCTDSVSVLLLLFIVYNLHRSPNSSVRHILEEAAGRWVHYSLHAVHLLSYSDCAFSHTSLSLFVHLPLMDTGFFLMLGLKRNVTLVPETMFLVFWPCPDHTTTSPEKIILNCFSNGCSVVSSKCSTLIWHQVMYLWYTQK